MGVGKDEKFSLDSGRVLGKIHDAELLIVGSEERSCRPRSTVTNEVEDRNGPVKASRIKKM